jgi:RHS repeat-associated protein
MSLAISRRRSSRRPERRLASNLARPAMLEALEERCLLATFHWANNVDGNFNDPTMWLNQLNQQGVPGPNDDATVGFSGIVVTSPASASVNSLTFNQVARLSVTGGTFSLANVLTNSQLQQLVIANGATLSVTGGTLGVVNNSSISGSIASAGTIDFSAGVTTVNSTASLGGVGLYQVAGATFTVSGAVAAPSSFELDSGSVNGSGTFTVGGNFAWKGGTIGGAGAVNISASGVLALSGGAAKILDSTTLTNAGAITLAGAGNLGISNGATLDNAGLFDIKSDASVLYTGGVVGAVVNESTGTIQKSGGGGTSTAANNLAFNNVGGTVAAKSGTLALSGGSSGGGTYTAAAGSVLDLTNGGTQVYTGTFSGSGAGVVELTSGAITVGAAGATFNFAPSVFQWIGGTLTGGTLTNTASFGISGGSAKSLNAVTLVNAAAGTVTWTGAGDLQQSNNAQISNAGAFLDQADHRLVYTGGVGGTFTNTGSFTKSVGAASPAQTRMNIVFVSSGALNVQSGNFETEAATITGPVNLSAGGSFVAGAGQEIFNAGATLAGAGALVVNGGELTINVPITAANVSIVSSTLDGSGAVTVSNQLSWTGGAMAGSGQTIIGPQATLDIAGSAVKTLDSRTLTNNGTVIWDGTGQLNQQNADTINNNGVWLDQADHTIRYSGGVGGVFNNAGTYTKSVGAASPNETWLNITFNNPGIVNLQSGVIEDDGGLVTGKFNLTAGTVLLINAGATTFGAGAAVNGAGLVDVGNNATLVISSPITIVNFELDSATLTGASALTVTGSFAWTNGAMTGTGSTVIAPGASLEITGPASKLIDARTLTNNGTVIWSGVGQISQSSGDTINNNAAWLDQADHTIRYAGGVGGVFNNAGTYIKSVGAAAPAMTWLNITLNNSGAMHVLAGNVEVDGGSLTGSFNLAANTSARFDANVTTLNAGATFVGPGLAEVGPNATLSVNAPASIPNLEINGQLAGSNALTITNIATWAAGSFTGTGSTIIAPGAQLKIHSTAALVFDSRTITNQGTTTWDTTPDINVSNNSVFNNVGTFLDQNDHQFRYAGGLVMTFHNAGLYKKTVGAVGMQTAMINNLDNTGTIEVDSGTLHVVAGATVAQINNGTLTAGAWILNGGTFLSDLGGNITTSNASVTLNGPGAAWAALNTLTTNNGTLDLEGGKTFTVASDFTNNGSLILGPASTLAISGKYAQGPNATLTTEIAGQPASGLFGKLTATGAATLNGALAVKLVNGFGTTAGGNFQILSYPSETGDFTSFTATTEGGQALFTHGTNPTNVTVTSVKDASDLAVKSVNPSSAGTPGQPLSVTYTVHNNSATAADVTTWTDSVYLSLSDTFDPSTALLLGRVQHTTGVGANADYSETLSNVPLPALAPGGYRVFVLADSRQFVPDPDRSNNVGVSTFLVTVTLPVAPVGSTTNGTISNGQDEFFRVDLPGGSAVRITATFAAAPGGELYVRYRDVPDRNTFDESSTDPALTVQTILLPSTQAGPYYVLIHGREGSAAGKAFSLKFEQLPLQILDVSPNHAANVGLATVTIHGSQFTADTTVALVQNGGTPRAATNVALLDSSTLFATFNLAGAAIGTYALRVTAAGQTATLPSAYSVETGNPGHVTVSLGAPSVVRNGHTGVVTIDYANDGDADVGAPIIILTAQTASGLTTIPLKLSDQTDFGASTLQFLGINTQGAAGILPAGYHGTVSVDFLAPATIGGHDTIKFSTSIVSGDTQPIDFTAFKSALKPSYIPADAWDAVFANFTAAVGATNGSYQAALDADSTYLSQLGEYNSDITSLVGFEIQKANALYTAQSLVSSTDASFPSPGLPMTFVREINQPISGRYRLGRLGRGWTDNWDISVSTDAQGNALVQEGGSILFFARQPDGSYAAGMGVESTLNQSAGLFQLREPDGGITAFNPDGSLKYKQDANGNRVTAGYSGNHLTSLTHSSGAVISINYNAQGLINQVTDPAGRTSTYTYDASQHLKTYTDKYGTTTYTYASGQGAAREHALTLIAFPDGTHLAYAYDAQGRLIDEQRDGGASEIRYSYGPAGGYTKTDADGGATTTLFDDMGQVAQTINPLGQISRFAYDAAGNLAKSVGPDGATTTFFHDASGNLTGETDALGNHYTLTYDPVFNRPLSIQDGRGNTTRYSYDGRGNLAGVTYADASAQTYTRDAKGEVIQSADPRGQTIVYTYNVNGQLTGKSFSDGTTETYAFDSHGNVTSATNSGTTTTAAYNALDLPTQIVGPAGTLNFQYNVVGQRTRSVDQTGFTVNYAYDSVGRLLKLTDGLGATLISYGYDPAGRLISETKGNSTSTTFQYDAAGNLLHLINKAADGATVNSQFDYTYNAAGLVANMTTGGVVTNYSYDADGQLTSVTLPGRTILYQYDAAGNRASVTDNSVATVYVANGRNEYTSVGSTSFTYDAAGNLATRTAGGATTTYTFDAQDRLLSQSDAVDTLSYKYDAFGDRVSTTHNNQTTNNLIDPSGPGVLDATFDAGGNVIAHFTYGLGLVSRVDSTSAAAYYDFDIDGSTAGLTGASGSYVNKYSYLPFGATTTLSAGLANPFTYAGRFGVTSDGGGLLDMRFRNYDPATGQFISNDPLGLVGGDVNLRRYVSNDPVLVIDPSGLKPSTPHVCPASSADQWGKIGAGILGAGGAIAGGFAGAEGGPVGIGLGAVGVGAVGGAVGYGVGFGAAKIGDGFNAVGGFFQNNLIDPLSSGGNNGGSPNDPDGDSCSFPPPPPPPPPEPPGKPGPAGHTDPRTPNDPNELIGPAGFGAQGFIPSGRTLPYSIQFENKPTASAPAQEVIVTQTLDPNLDFTTFELGDIGFGNTVVHIPAGRNSYSTRIDATATLGLFVDITASINFSTGLVTWDFKSIDPATGDLTSDPLAGFLPPDATSPQGEGFVNYSIRAKSALATGAAVHAQASVVFDQNAPLATAPIVNTLDVGPPASSVQPLSAHSKSGFTLRWSGADDANGSGIATFSIFVSDNNGPFAPFLTKTAQTSAPFTGQLGHTYRFYSVATDNVGNIQTTPAAPQASTTIAAGATPGDFDGDGKTDTAIYDQSQSRFFVLESGGSALTPQFGNPADVNIPIAGDFDGDGKSDTAIYDQSKSQFFILLSGGGAKTPQFGNPADVNIPIAGDFDGDGKSEVAIYDQTKSQFFILLSGGGAKTPQFGNPAHTNVPVSGDFDGDGKADTSIYDQTSSQFFVLLSGGGAKTPQFGNPAHVNVPVSGDFDGDGKADTAIYDQTSSQYFVLLSGGGAKTPQFGNPAHVNVPVGGDFDGDGKADTAIYDQTSSQFFVLLSGGGAKTPQFGNPAHVNVPLPSVYLRGHTRSPSIGTLSRAASFAFDFASAAATFSAGPASARSSASATVTTTIKNLAASPRLAARPSHDATSADALPVIPVSSRHIPKRKPRHGRSS